jgi:hypothetical protein
MPTIAKAGTLMSSGTSRAVRADAKAPPIVAPMNSDGEKIPPDEPEPRLVVVANGLQTNNSANSQAVLSWPSTIACTVA